MNIKSLLSQKRVPFKAVPNSTEITLECPECGKQKDHFYFNTLSGLGFCHLCGFKTNYKTLLKKLGIKFTKIDSLDEIQERLWTAKPDELEKEIIPIALPKEAELIQSATSAAKYLQSRRITKWQATKHKLMFCRTGKYTGRIIVPIFNENNKIVNFVARDITGKAERKYLYPKGSNISHCLYNLRSIASKVILVEGVFDCLPHSGLSIVAIFGKHLSDTQLCLLLKKRVSEVVVMLDPDALGDMEILADRLFKHFKVKIVLLSDDPSEFTSRYLMNIIENTSYWKSIESKMEDLEEGE